MNIADIRKEYILQSLSENDIETDPILQFNKWWNQAIESNIEEVNAMTLATVNKEGMPSARIVLLKGFDSNGFVFFTNYLSKKGTDLEINPKACIVFFWKELERQVRVEGIVNKINESESDDYFQSRPNISKIGAWASPQSQEITSRESLENKFKEYESEFKDGNIKRPDHWGGYRLNPNKIEFWQGRPGRLHDRIEYAKSGENNWKVVRLAP